MPGFRTVSEYANAQLNGCYHWCSIRKVPSQATTAGWWADLSMAAGNPKPNYYASGPLAAAVLDSYDGIFHGADKSPKTKHLTGMGFVTPTAAFVGQYILMDYLMFYPFVDGDEVSSQPMVNSVTLPRYTDGAGVMVMAVNTAPTTGGGKFRFDYIDQDGNAKTSPVQSCSSTSGNIATLLTSQQNVAGMPGGPFLALASGSTGVRSITGVQMVAPNGGLFSLVLVKVLADIAIREINTTSELEFVTRRAGCPRIYDGAYLNLICNVAGSVAAGTLTGYASFAWSES